MNLAENVGKNFKEIFSIVFNQFKDNVIEMSQEIEENLVAKEKKKKKSKEMSKKRKIEKLKKNKELD